MAGPSGAASAGTAAPEPRAPSRLPAAQGPDAATSYSAAAPAAAPPPSPPSQPESATAAPEGPPPEQPSDSVSKLWAVLGLCERLGVGVRPVRLGPLRLVPLLSWHHQVGLADRTGCDVMRAPEVLGTIAAAGGQAVRGQWPVRLGPLRCLPCQAWDMEPDVPGLPRATPLTITDYARCVWPEGLWRRGAVPEQACGPGSERARAEGGGEEADGAPRSSPGGLAGGHGSCAVAAWFDALNDAPAWPVLAPSPASSRDACAAEATGHAGHAGGGAEGSGGVRGGAPWPPASSPPPGATLSFSHFLPHQALLPEKRFLVFPSLVCPPAALCPRPSTSDLFGRHSSLSPQPRPPLPYGCPPAGPPAPFGAARSMPCWGSPITPCPLAVRSSRPAPQAKAVGSSYLAARVAQLRPHMHVFGHTHFSWDSQLHDGVRYVQVRRALIVRHRAFLYKPMHPHVEVRSATARSQGLTRPQGAALYFHVSAPTPSTYRHRSPTPRSAASGCARWP